MLYFEKSYFEGEEKDGFYVRPMMKRVWAAQLEMLQIVEAICNRHNIQYFADWGTLLGAVRHQGYIPWDDDLDICMLRADYEYFLQVAEQELPEYFDILNANTYPEWESEFTRVVNSKKLPLEKEIEQRFQNCPYLVGVDICPIDYLPDNEEEVKVHVDLFRAVYRLALDIRNKMKITQEHLQSLNIIQKLCDVKFTGETPIQQQLQILSDNIAGMYMDMGEEAKECTLMYYMADHEKFRFSASCFKSAVRMPFENITIPVPVGYREILEVYYGKNYMTPVQSVAQHEYPYYKKQQPYMIQYYEENGLPVPEYLREE